MVVLIADDSPLIRERLAKLITARELEMSLLEAGDKACSWSSCEGQDFRELCRSFGGNSLPTLPAGSIWRKADGRMDLCVRTVAAGSIG